MIEELLVEPVLDLVDFVGGRVLLHEPGGGYKREECEQKQRLVHFLMFIEGERGNRDLR